MRAKLSQRALADRCSVSQPSVVGWESGERAVSEETLAKVGRALGHKTVEQFICYIVPIWKREGANVERRSA